MEKNKVLGERLKRLRGNRTQEEISKALGLSRARYSHYENNRVEPDTETLNKIADFFSVSVDYLLGRTDNTEPNQNLSKSKLTEKDEKDIAKRMEKIKKDLKNAEGLSFHGEPLSEEAIESLLEAIEHAERIATLTNKKYIPKKYRKN